MKRKSRFELRDYTVELNGLVYRLVDDGYASLPFPFDELKAPDFTIELRWSLADLLGYLRTWSPTHRFIEMHGRDPVGIVNRQVLSTPGWRKRIDGYRASFA